MIYYYTMSNVYYRSTPPREFPVDGAVCVVDLITEKVISVQEMHAQIK